MEKSVSLNLLFVIYFVITLFSLASANIKTYVNAKANVNFTNVIINNVAAIGIVNGQNLITCSKLCLDNIYCMSFFYNHITNECKIFDVDFTNPAQGINVNGWKYYTATRDCKINGRTCPESNGYKFVSELCMCYKYVGIQSVHANARQYCSQESGYLVKIDRLLKLDEIQRFLGTVPNPIEPNGDVFIQGTRVGNSTKWIFDNGHEMRYFAWNTAKLQPELRVGENVIAIQKIWGSLWHDTLETTSIMFICEIPL